MTTSQALEAAASVNTGLQIPTSAFLALRRNLGLSVLRLLSFWLFDERLHACNFNPGLRVVEEGHPEIDGVKAPNNLGGSSLTENPLLPNSIFLGRVLDESKPVILPF